jgi:hypothetical protein
MSYRCYECAIHEAGHVVAGLAAGWPIIAVEVNEDGDTGVVHFDPPPFGGFGDLEGEQASLVIDLAGWMAEELNLEDYKRGCWPRAALRSQTGGLVAAYARSRRPRRRISDFFRAGRGPGHADEAKEVGDFEKAPVKAERLVVSREMAAWSASPESRGVSKKSFDIPTQEAVLAELLEGERRAEALLRERWPDVRRVAEALCRSKRRRLTSAQVRRLLKKAPA